MSTQVCQASYFIIHHVSIVHHFFITLHHVFIMFPASLVMFHRDFVIILRHVSSSTIIHQKFLHAKQVAVSIQHHLSLQLPEKVYFPIQKKDHDYPSLPIQEPPCHNTDLGNVVQQIDLATDHNILEGRWPTVSTPSQARQKWHTLRKEDHTRTQRIRGYNHGDRCCPPRIAVELHGL